MTDSAHDKEHVYRVLYVALDIAKYEECADIDVLITASLLQDIGRKEQFLIRVFVMHSGQPKAYISYTIGFSKKGLSI
jgi:uncharacterized protein